MKIKFKKSQNKNTKKWKSRNNRVRNPKIQIIWILEKEKRNKILQEHSLYSQIPNVREGTIQIFK